MTQVFHDVHVYRSLRYSFNVYMLTNSPIFTDLSLQSSLPSQTNSGRIHDPSEHRNSSSSHRTASHDSCVSS